MANHRISDNLRRRLSSLTEITEYKAIRHDLTEEWDLDMQEMVNDENKDAITDVVGQMGRYQWMMILLFSLMEFPHAWTMLSHKFISPEVDHWCSPPPHLNWTTLEWRNFSSPPGDSCNIYNRNFSSFADLSFSEAMKTLDPTTDLVSCSSWEYDTSQFQNTLSQKWDLVCDRKHLTNVASSVYFAGTAVGIFLSGLLADKLGRRTVMIFFILLFCVSGMVSSLCSSFHVWLAGRFMWGVSAPAIWSVKTVMSLELVGSKWRALACVGFLQGFWSLGYCSLPLLSYLFPDASNLQMVITLVMVPAIGCMYKITESPRWLLARGRIDQCQEALQYILKINKVEKKFSLDEDYASSNHGTCLDLLKNPTLRRNTIVMSFAWFSLGCFYFGLSLNMPDFDADMYVMFFISGLVEVPAAFIVPFLLNRFGRRLNLIYHFIIGGVLCIATAIVPLGVFRFEWPIMVLTLLGKYVSQACWGIVNLYTNELFPTGLRAEAVSLCCTFARLGSVISPYIASLDDLSPVLPVIVFGTMILSSGVLSILLPDADIHLS